MPKFPPYSASTRLATGGASGSTTPFSIGRPNLLSPSILQHRSIEAPFYTAQVDEVGPFVRNKAINQFGEVLLDVSITLADRRAKLEAEDRTHEYYENVRDLEMQYYQLTGRDAIDGYGPFVENINRLEKEALDKTSNHAKIYLTRSLRNVKNSSLGTAARYNATQYKVASQRAVDQQLMRTSDQLKDYVYETDFKKVKEFISTALDDIGFVTLVDKQEAQDQLYGELLKHQLGSIVIEGENSSDATLYKRLSALQDRLEAYKPELSLKSYVAFSNSVVKAASQVANEIDKREMERIKSADAMSKSIINEIYGALNKDQPFPTALVNMGKTLGVLTERNEYTLKGLFDRKAKDKSGSSTRTQEQTANYLDYISRVTTNEGFESIQKDLLRDAESGAMRSEDIMSVSKMASTAYDSLYRQTLSRGKEQGDLLIMTAGTLSNIRKPEETELLSKYLDDFQTRLTLLQDSNKLNPQTAKELLDSLKEEYGAEVQWLRAPYFRTMDRSVAHPKNYEELTEALRDIAGRTLPREEKIKALELKEVYEHIFEIREKYSK